MERVVVAGMGVICPLGLNIGEFRTNKAAIAPQPVVACESANDFDTLFHPSPLGSLLFNNHT